MSFLLVKEQQENTIEDFIASFPNHWFNQFPGALLNQTCIFFDNNYSTELSQTRLSKVFGEHQLIGNFVENQSARVWTSYGKESNSAICYFSVEDLSLGPRRTGRLAQHIIEMENYRVLAGLSFVLAEEIIFVLKKSYLYIIVM